MVEIYLRNSINCPAHRRLRDSWDFLFYNNLILLFSVFTERPCGCCSFVGKRGNGPQVEQYSISPEPRGSTLLTKNNTPRQSLLERTATSLVSWYTSWDMWWDSGTNIPGLTGRTCSKYSNTLSSQSGHKYHSYISNSTHDVFIWINIKFQ